MPELLGKKIRTPHMIAAGVAALALGAGIGAATSGGEQAVPQARTATEQPVDIGQTGSAITAAETTSTMPETTLPVTSEVTTSAPAETTTVPKATTTLAPVVLAGGSTNQGGEVTRNPEELPALTRESIEASLQPYVDKYTTNPNSTTFTKDGKVMTNFNLPYRDGEIQGFWSAHLEVNPETHKIIAFTVGAYGGDMETGDGVEPATVASVRFTDTDFTLGYEIAGQPVDLVDDVQRNTAFTDMRTMTDASLVGTSFSVVPLATRANP